MQIGRTSLLLSLAASSIALYSVNPVAAPDQIEKVAKANVQTISTPGHLEWTSRLHSRATQKKRRPRQAGSKSREIRVCIKKQAS